jgi:4-hydroxymandelate oxidase
VGPTEKQWATSLTRRRALAALGGMLASSPSVLRAQLDPRSTERQERIPSLNELLEVFEFEPIAKDNVTRAAWNWTARGRDGEWTLRRNRIAFDWIDLVERPSGTVDSVDTSTEVLGTRMSHPIYAAPSTAQVQMHPSGDAGTYEGIAATGGVMCLASGSSIPHPQVIAAADGPRWNQIYPGQDLERNGSSMRTWLEQGTRSIQITIDHTAAQYDSQLRIRWLGARTPPPAGESEPRPPRRTLSGPQRYGVTPFPDRMWVSWDFVDQVRDLTPEVPVLLKGVMTADDARIAAERGYDGIVISNHGARTLEYVPSTIEVLPEIVDAVAGRMPVLIDSGFRNGYDVFKALALGADAVSIGRVPRWGLGAFGPAGVKRIVEIMQMELREAMVRTGRPTIASIDRTAVRTNFI